MKTNPNLNYELLFAKKKFMMEEVENLLREVTYRENAIITKLEEDGAEQRKDRDGNLLYVDENGNNTTEVTDKPSMRPTYKEVPVPLDELSENDRHRYEAIQLIKEALMSLV